VRDALGNPQTALLLGGTSDIGLATLRAMIGRRLRTVVLAGRDLEATRAAAEELTDLGATTVEVEPFDACATETHAALVDRVFDRLHDVDVVIVAFGVLGDQDRAEVDNAEAARIATTNYLGAVTTILPVARRMKAQGHGTIVVLSSVAGERARRSNFVYGSTKAGLDALAQGLGDALHGSGVGVLIVRPGFVRSSMTEGMDPAPLSTGPDAVAQAIITGMGRGSAVVHVPGTLRWVFVVLRHLPRAVFRRLPL
jgi:decaprenylphospho-beta-D-erythro-pentofuranosid-2-ulose 2-reductase